MSEPAVEPQLGEPGGDPAAEPAEQPWAPSQEEWSQTIQAVQYLASLEQQRAQVYQPREGAQQPEIDPWAPDFANQLVGLIRQEMTPYQQFQQEQVLGEAEERAMDILQDLATRDGEFDLQVARLRADSLLPAMQQTYGFGPKAAEEALAKAAADQREWEATRDANAVARHTNHLAVLSGAPGEPGSTYAQGTQQRVMPDYRQGGSVTQQFFGQKAPA